jgi:hypothetical protein
MNLTIPHMPSIFLDQNLEQRILWEKWVAFWWLPIERKADIVDYYPELVIEQKRPGAANRVYFNPEVFDKQVPYGQLRRHYDVITDMDEFPLQYMHDLRFQLSVGDPEELKNILLRSLTSFNYAVLAYKYRYMVRPEHYYFGGDYETALLNMTTLQELLTFYDLTRKN